MRENFFDLKNEECFLELLPSAERRHNLSSVLEKFRSLRKVYRALKPVRDKVTKCKVTAVKMGRELLDNFGYVMWPNYLHKLIEHVQDILDVPDSIGALSGEGSEAANKLFRHLRKYASRSTVEESLREVLWFHWMYTSPKLRALRATSLVKRKYHCSICGEGHSKLTCPSTPSTSK
nr:V(D)J recombination-activating protein 1-like [Lytechinus pictus]